ncbi:cytochrome P450 [Coniophora puteana RWD-64-598 SS2]|uniref:Cytochrome P450 n=1 Tax=Coniophora puteana (strain RWD-64-598) TaxID=741705 RepID=A0A5M3N8T8_CONPW|nr:cytochrome P450 [Coniophora puteana RWD-64-598 SS2]EIW87255.1 cytochrome P450 [Coniophora puteana RWD-64-598 SS2]
MPLSAWNCLDATVAVFALFLLRELYTRTSMLPFPPGPKPWPLIGNLLDMPSSSPWITFAAWKKQYGESHMNGPISSISIFGQPIVFLNSPHEAIELLDKKSSIYSNRPVLPMVGELVGHKNSMSLLQYGDRYRRYRTMMHQFMGTRAAARRHAATIEHETKRFIANVFHSPEKLNEHVRLEIGAIILKLGYGYDAKGADDSLIKLVEQVLVEFAYAATPGAFLVDIIPWLRYVPAWFPGTRWKRLADQYRQNVMDYLERPWAYAKEQMELGIAQPSYCLMNIEKYGGDALQEDIIKWSASTLYGGGSPCPTSFRTVSSIYAFYLAMTLRPDVQRKAQAEIDAAVGPDRLPTADDLPSLPYIEALSKETLRWFPVAPLGLPHCTTEDDVYNGFFIPKGSIVQANLWAMLRDEDVYPDPSAFAPERFLGATPQTDPRTICFGYGRRICPGMHVAELSLSLAIAMTLSVFDIAPVVGENGKEVLPKIGVIPGIISHPAPFKCQIKPRSASAERILDHLASCL